MGSNKGSKAASGRLDALLGIFVAIGVAGVVSGVVLWIGVEGNSADQNLAADPLVETSVSDNESIIDLPTTTANEIAIQTSTTRPTPSLSVTTTTAPMYPTECTDPIDGTFIGGPPLFSSWFREFAYVAPEERQRVVVEAKPISDVQFVCAHVRHTSNSIQEEWQTEVLLEPNGRPWGDAREASFSWSFTFVPPADAPLGEYEVFLTAVDSSGLPYSRQITSFDLVDPSESESS